MMYEIHKRGNGDIYRIRYEWLVIGFADSNKSGKELRQFNTLTEAEGFCAKHCAKYAEMNIRKEEFIDEFDSEFMECVTDLIDKESCWNKSECSSSGLYAVYDTNGKITTYREKPKTHTRTEALEILRQDKRDYYFVPNGNGYYQHGTEIIPVKLTKAQYEAEISKPIGQRDGVYFDSYAAASYYVND